MSRSGLNVQYQFNIRHIAEDTKLNIKLDKFNIATIGLPYHNCNTGNPQSKCKKKLDLKSYPRKPIPISTLSLILTLLLPLQSARQF